MVIMGFGATPFGEITPPALARELFLFERLAHMK